MLIEQFRDIVLEKRPLIDVRAPVEFEQGAFQHAVNLPLMNDHERHLVGTCYKEQGSDAAMELGHRLVHGELRKARIEAWKQFIQTRPDAYLYCFRGGDRSRIAQEWLKEEGIEIPRLKGGYKAFRNYLMQTSEEISAKRDFVIIGGRTGSGKTLLLHKLDNAIDLEGLANHRGSSFGNYISAQPTQINFENDLSYALINMDEQDPKKIVIEHESRNISRVYIPKPVYDNFEKGSLILLETDIEERIEITHQEYVLDALERYIEQFGPSGEEVWAENIKMSMGRIQKRLGSQRYLTLMKLFDEAFSAQLASHDLEKHKVWIDVLLEAYYDPMYDYQIQKSEIPVIFKGNKEEVLQFLQKDR
jgi:tRNA 2-selenouridine synthase